MKRLFLVLVMAIAFVLALTVAVSAESVHNGKVDLNQKVTLSDGTECALFDAEGNALIWFIDNTGALKSIRADIGIEGENKVDYIIDAYAGALAGFNGVSITQIDRVIITYNGVTYDAKSIVVFNIMDDDVVVTSCTKTNYNGYIGKPVDSFQSLFSEATTLQYAFLRLDTVAIQASVFNKATNLKYVNLEDLTKMVQIAGSGFYECASLGPNIVLPNSLINIGTACFRGCSSLETIRLGEKVSGVGSWDFLMNCPKLTTVYIPGTLTNITINSFKDSPNITTVFYTGDVTAANAFMTSANNSGGNGYVTALTLISNDEYKKLEDKSGKYFVYDYSVCNAFYNGNHEFDIEKSNDCAGICGTCGEVALKANPIHNYVTTISYAKGYLNTGIKTETCQNAGCAHENGYESVVEAVATFNGISVKIKGDGLTFGFTINYEALDELVKITGKSVELGFVVGVKDFIDGEVYGNQNAVTASVLTWIVETEEEKNEVKYASADFVLRGTWDRMVDLDGDETAETDVKDVEFYMAGYLATNNTVSYLNASDNFTSPDVVTYSGCNQ